MKVLVTGGAGYIGSHTIIELDKAGHEIVVVDNLANSSEESMRRVEKIVGKAVPFHKFDLREQQKLDELFANEQFDAVIHFAGLKAVGESVENPLLYYQTNLGATLVLLECMQKHNVKTIVFSSSATVYGTPSELPLREISRVGVGITNPYGQTKYMLENILRDVASADTSWSVTLLRYFNPIGAHESGNIGEDPSGIPNNLLPYVAQVAVGKREKVSVFGGDYDTLDGTGVRDYIHVIDLARGHLAALEHTKLGINVYNLGTGSGVSVLEIINAFQAASGKTIPYEIVARRRGDVASCYADCTLAEKELGWKAEKTLEDACTDSWRWQSQNPDGYAR